MTASDQPIRFAGAVLEQNRHVCAFFDDEEQEHRIMGPFVKEGLQRGEKAFHIVDPVRRAAYIDRLEQAAIPVNAALATGQFEVRNWDEAYLREGRFDQEAMLSLIKEVLDTAGRSYPLTRLVAHMEWSLLDRPGVDDLVEYEARLNYLLPRYRDPVI